MMLSFKYTICFLFLTSIVTAVVASLEAIEVGKLPSALSSQSPFYDEKSDSICSVDAYGFIPETISNYDIYAFSVSNNPITKVGEIQTNVGKFTTTHVIPSSKSDTSHLLVLFCPTFLRSIHCRLFIQ